MDERTATAAPPSTQLDLVRMQHLVAVEAIHTELARIVKYLVGGGAGRARRAFFAEEVIAIVVCGLKLT